jgi:NAD(P)-dependent dehydrogenase (short-subunit alcohol dehydrogenase family)
MMRLAGRYAIITGASQGFGEAIAEHYVAEGASVILCARNSAAVETVAQRLGATAKAGQKVLARKVDVSDVSQIAALVQTAVDAFGRIDVLVNNAGVYGPMGPTHEVDAAEWMHAVSINLFGVFHACRAVTPIMIAQKFGKIVNISGGGATNPLPRITSYAASKAAVVRLSESLSLELKEHGIDVNSIAPGALATQMMRQLLDAGPDKVGADFYARMTKINAEGGTPLHVGAELAVYLASEESNGITGRLISAVWDPWRKLADHVEDLAATDIYTLRRIVPSDRGRHWDG